MSTRIQTESMKDTWLHLDVTERVSRKTKTNITDYPVAKGLNITSLATTKNTKYTLRGVMSDSGSPNRLEGNQFISTGAVTQFLDDERARETDDILRNAQLNGEYVTVELGYGFTEDENPNQKVLDNLIIESWDIDITPNNFKGYSWSLSLVEPRIRIITNSSGEFVLADDQVKEVTAPLQNDTNKVAKEPIDTKSTTLFTRAGS